MYQIFDSFLCHEFKDLPGELNVRQGQFHMVDRNRRSLIIAKDEWEKYIFPGTNVEMSMIVSKSQIADRCPRPGCDGRNRRSAGSDIVTWLVDASRIVTKTNFCLGSKLCNLQYTVRGEASPKRNRGYYEDSDIYKRAEIYGLFIIPHVTYSVQSSGSATTKPEDEDDFSQSDTFVSTKGGEMISLYDRREMESHARILSELEVFRRVHVRFETPVVSARRPDFDAHAAAEDCIQVLASRTPDLTVFVQLLPRLSHENVLALQRSYTALRAGSQVKAGLSVEIQRSITDKLGEVCHAVSLGQWESEVHWIKVWYQNKDSQWREALRFLLIEAVLGRTATELEAIMAAFSDKLYKNDLMRCLESELEGHGLKSLVLAAFRAPPPRRALNGSDPARVALRLHNMFQTTDDERTRESILIDILTKETSFFVREVIHEYQRNYQASLARAIGRAVSTVVVSLKPGATLNGSHQTDGPQSDGLLHIVNGALDSDARDAALIHFALYPKALRRVPQVLISRLVRMHWDLSRRDAVVGYYKAFTGWPLERSIKAATDGQFRDFCLNLIE